MPLHTRIIRRNEASLQYRITSTMRDLIRIGYYNSPLPIDRSRISLTFTKLGSACLRIARALSLSPSLFLLLPLSRSSPLTASLHLYFSVLNRYRCSGIHLAKYKQEAYIAFCISRHPNSNNQTNYVCIGEVVQNEQRLRTFLLLIRFTLDKRHFIILARIYNYTKTFCTII